MSQRVQGKHRQWQAMLQAEMSHAPDATRALCEPATRLNPIETMLLLRRLRPEPLAASRGTVGCHVSRAGRDASLCEPFAA